MPNLRDFVQQFFQALWMLILEGGPFLLVGLVAAGLIRSFLRVETVGRWLGANTVWSAVKAALLGAPLPICSCGVVPAAFALRKQGASRSATLSFLITTPETGVDSIALTYAFLGPAMTLIRPVAAIFTGITAGVLEMLLGVKDPCETKETPAKSCCCRQKNGGESPAQPASLIPVPWWSRFVAGQSYAFGPMLRDISGWMLLGLIIAAVIQVVLPADIIATGTARFGLPHWVWYGIMAVVGVPMYICATMATPVMAALMLKGLSPGAALVFLLAGPATNVATIGLIRKYMGGRSVAIYLSAIVICAVVFGAVVDAVAAVRPVPFVPALAPCAEHALLPNYLAVPLAGIVLLLLLWGFFRRWRNQPELTEPEVLPAPAGAER